MGLAPFSALQEFLISCLFSAIWEDIVKKKWGHALLGERQRNPLGHTETTAIVEAISSSSGHRETQHLGPFDTIVGLDFHGNYQVARSIGMSKFFSTIIILKDFPFFLVHIHMVVSMETRIEISRIRKSQILAIS